MGRSLLETGDPDFRSRYAGNALIAHGRLPPGYEKGWNVRYTTDLTEPVWFYVRGEEYSTQLDYFVRCIEEKRVGDNLNSFANAIVTDKAMAMMVADAARGLMKTIDLVAGARPNFMKIAPIVRALQAHGGLAFKIIHIGQHYDREMNDVFFEELGIPESYVFMAVGGGSHAQQTAKIMVAFEELWQGERPDVVPVVGDVNSTLACSIVVKKLNIPVGHVEAGLRSGDMTMPEEINRRVTDSISDWFFVTEPSGVAHLPREGKAASAIFCVG